LALALKAKSLALASKAKSLALEAKSLALALRVVALTPSLPKTATVAEFGYYSGQGFSLIVQEHDVITECSSEMNVFPVGAKLAVLFLGAKFQNKRKYKMAVN